METLSPTLETELVLSAEERATWRLAPETIAKAVAMLREQGSLVIRDALDPALPAAMNEHFNRYYAGEGYDRLRSTTEAVGNKRLIVPVEVEGPFADPRLYGGWVAVPIMLAALETNLSEMVVNSWACVVAFPGAKDQPVHRDHPWLFQQDMPSSLSVPPYCITMVVPMVELTPETGTTAVWNGTHRKPQAISAETADVAPMLPYVPLGSIYLMDYRVLHGGTANNSSIPKPIFCGIFSRSWFRDAANFNKLDPIVISKAGKEQIAEHLRPMWRQARPYDVPIHNPRMAD